MDGLGMFGTMLAEMNPPLPAMLSLLEELVHSQKDVQAASSRIGGIVGDLRKFSRPSAAALGLTDLVRSIEWAVRSTSTEFRDRARVVCDTAAVLPLVRADEIKLGQVACNGASRNIAERYVAKAEIGGRILAQAVSIYMHGVSKMLSRPLPRKAGEAALGGEELLHRALLDVALLRDQRLERRDQIVHVTQCLGYAILLVCIWHPDFIIHHLTLLSVD